VEDLIPAAYGFEWGAYVLSFTGSPLRGHELILIAAVLLDLLLGDPVYRAHPIRLMGQLLAAIERGLRRVGLDGYGGGILLFVLLASVSVGTVSGLVLGAAAIGSAIGATDGTAGTVGTAGTAGAPWWAWGVHLFFLYSMLALGDLLRHVWRVERALDRGTLADGRKAIAWLVGRDTDRMDAAACRRAAVESLSESLTDAVASPLFWYVLLGLPGVVLFKVVSTMDSMVGYKTPRYLRFGWCGARADDLMNYVPARLTWLLIALVAGGVHGFSMLKALRIGWTQHATLPGPNSGWSEAATAGALQRRIVGPIWLNGEMKTDVWIGDPADPPVETRTDLMRAMLLVTATALASTILAAVTLIVV
jgi:adenosylcobinamide-phosphate synthase